MTVRFYIDEDEVQKAAQRMNEPMSTEDAERFLDRNEAFLLNDLQSALEEILEEMLERTRWQRRPMSERTGRWLNARTEPEAAE